MVSLRTTCEMQGCCSQAKNLKEWYTFLTSWIGMSSIISWVLGVMLSTIFDGSSSC